jgi:phthiodiolone/phenolphthiodiolone dimycocerosates ketoreductase
MTAQPLKSAILSWGNRYAPPAFLQEQARALAASGVVDHFSMSDHMGQFIPPSLWKPGFSPVAAVLPDVESLDDPFVMSAYALAAAPELGLSITTDAIRHGPAQLIRAALSLANITGGDMSLHVGAGEAQQVTPFGWKRTQGFRRLSDLLQIYSKLFDSDEPIDFEGEFWRFKQGFLGNAKQHRPKLITMGNGPKLLDLTTTYADGLCSGAPVVWATPEQCAQRIAALRRDLERKGRDPEAFEFRMYVVTLIHDDPAAIDAALDNPLVRRMAAVFGRLNPADWPASGLRSPVPEGWTYFMNLTPRTTPTAFIDETLQTTTRAHAERAFFHGSAAEIAAAVQPYVDAGVSWVAPFDLMALIGRPEDAPLALERSIELCRILKATAAAKPAVDVAVHS